MDFLEAFTELLPIAVPFALAKLEKDEASQIVHIYLQIDAMATPANHRIHSYYERTWEHLKLFQYRCFIHCRLPIYQDKNTGGFSKTNVSFSRDYSRFTLLYEQEVMRLMKIHHCLSTVARNLGINVQRVESIYHYYTQDYTSDTISETPINVAFDETSTHKGHQYITSFYDLDRQEIIGIYTGKSSECVKQFMQDHPYPEALQNISIDMSPAFISGCKQYFAQAAITFDKWHVIKLLYKQLDNLADNASHFRAYITLLMEDIANFYQQNQLDEFQAQLQFMADFAQETLGNNALTKTILSHFEGISNYVKSKINNGIMEGINAKIQVIKRVARGFRYTENFKKMIRFVFSKPNLQVIS